MLIDQLICRDPKLEKILKNMPEAIKDRCIVREIPSGSIIVRKDDDLTSFSIICKGKVRIINEFDNGNVYLIEQNQAIDFIGEVTALAGERKTSVTIEAITNCIIIQMSLKDFYKWIEADNNFLLMISKGVASKLYTSSYTKGVELFYPAIHLLVDFLIDYSGKDINKKDKAIVLLTRQQISEKLGVTVKTVNRTIKRLKDEDMISVSKGKINVCKGQYKKLVQAMKDRRYI